MWIPGLRIQRVSSECEQVLRLVPVLALFLSAAVAAAERTWDQEAAKKKVNEMLAVERERRQPWNAIPWHTNPQTALAESREKRRPLLVFMFAEADGPPIEKCCLSGRLIRSLTLPDPEVERKITGSFVPLKLVYRPGKGFGVGWPVLQKWENRFKFAGSDGAAGCSVINADLTMEFANSGSSLISELFDSTAYDKRKFSRMLSRGYQRWKEDGIIRREGGLSVKEVADEVARHRSGVAFEVTREAEMRIPPKGYSLEKAVELFEMAGGR